MRSFTLASVAGSGACSLGWRRAITYQPDDRFWTFQAIEAGLFFALGLLAVVATLALVRRTPA